MNKVIKIQGLTCGHCVNAVSEIIKNIDGVHQVNVSLPDTAEVKFDEMKVTLDDIKQAINNSEIYKAL